MSLNFGDQSFGLREMDDMITQHHVGNGHLGLNGPAADVGVVAAGTPAGDEKALLNGIARTAAAEQQKHDLLPPAPQAPSSWASKVRAGIGSESSPTLSGNGGGSGGVGGGGGGGGDGLGPSGGGGDTLGGIVSGDLDTGVGEGIQGLPHGIGHLGPLASSLGGGAMGPVHGLDMEGGMPGRALMTPPAPARGSGVVQGLVGAGLDNGGQATIGLEGGGGANGSGALTQDFAGLEIGGGGGTLGARGTGTGEAQKGFDASKGELLGDFPCVRLRGLAADTSVKDILDFFVGLGPVLDIVLEGGTAGEEVGAITLFGTLMDYHGALQRYSLQIKGRYIEVAPAIRADYYSAVIKRSAEGSAEVAPTAPAGVGGGGEQAGDPAVQAQGQNGTAVHQTDQTDTTSAMGSAKAPGPAAAAVRAPQQGVQLPEAAGGAAASGSKGLTAQPAVAGVPAAGTLASGVQSPAKAGAQAGGVAGAGTGAAAGGGGGSGTRKGGVKAATHVPPAAPTKTKGSAGDAKGTVIRMRGLPYRASKSEVMCFFKGCSIPEEGVAFVTRADGRVTGEAYVRFATREDAKMGLRKDREMIGSRYIELFTSSPEEMARYANSKR